MTKFGELSSGALIHVLEITGTFRKSTTYSLGTVISVSNSYDEPLQPGQFPMPNTPRRKLVDLVISCDGEQRKLSVSEDKSIMSDPTIGLTIATDKQAIADKVRQTYNECRIKKESLAKYDEEMKRCESILKTLNEDSDLTTNVAEDFKKFNNLREEVKQIKNLLQEVMNNNSKTNPIEQIANKEIDNTKGG